MTTLDQNTFAQKLKKARTEAGLTQAQMAEITLIPYRTIQDWEGGKHSAPVYVQRFVLNELAALKKQ